MRIHVLQHVPFEGLGSMAHWIAAKGCYLTISRLFQGDPFPDLRQFDWLIVLGGPMGVYDEAQHPWLVMEKRLIEGAIRAEKIVLGICLGAQLIASVLGKRVVRNAEREIGWHPLRLTLAANRTSLFGFMPDELVAFHWHGDTFEIPDTAVSLASSQACANQAFLYGRRVVGLQFHLETTMASAQALVEHCADELVPGRYIQKPDEILASPRRFEIANDYMRGLLGRMALLYEAP
ncbi:MAG: type 1 glutamine amidotransferase [Chloroflexota bacterium]